MADVDLDVHGVRYAQIHTDLKRDMKLQGLGFVALLDFTTVDTLRASLERVISDKTDKEEKVDTMCYYKKRRRGAVVIRTQRDVMMACCEYPLVTRTGKPAPDTYIRVGVGLDGVDNKEYIPGGGVRGPGRHHGPQTPRIHPRPNVLGSLVRLNNNNSSQHKVMYRHFQPDPDAVTYITHGEPPGKRMCLDNVNSMGWHLVASSASPPHTMEIKPLGGSSSDPDRVSPTPSITIPEPPSLPFQIKSEPLDMDDEEIPPPPHLLVSAGVDRRGSGSDSLSSTRREKTSGSIDEQPTTDTTEDEEEQLQRSRTNSSSVHTSEASSAHDPGLKLMWEQLKKMESRLSYMEDTKPRGASPSPPELTPAPLTNHDEDDETDDPPRHVGDLTGQMAALERRLLAVEQSHRTQNQDPLVALDKRLAVMERNISRTLSSVDKLGKSLTTINRKHLKTNSAVDVLCESVKKIRETQILGQTTLESIQTLLEKGAS